MGNSVAVFVPLGEEMEYIHKYMVSKGAKPTRPYDPKTRYFAFSFRLSNRTLIQVQFHVMDEMGNLESACRLAEVKAAKNPDYAILVGIAGSLDPDVKLGDVVITSSAKVYFPDKVKELKPKREEWVAPLGADDAPIPGMIRVDKRKRILTESYFRYRRNFVDLETSRSVIDDYLHDCEIKAQIKLEGIDHENISGLDAKFNNLNPRHHSSTVFGSEMVIDSAEYAKFVLEKDKNDKFDIYKQKENDQNPNRNKHLLAPMQLVDMETYGFLMMGKRLYGENTPRVFSIRGISDFASDKAALDENTENEVRNIAVMNATSVAIDFIDFSLRRSAYS